MFLNVLIVLYALFQIGFGIWGTVQAHEIKSALGGVTIGILQFVCLALTPKFPRWGRIGSVVVALLVVGRFAKPFFGQGQWYPAGIEVVTSLVLVVALLLGHVLANRKKA